MGRSSRIVRLFGFVRHLLEGSGQDDSRNDSPWMRDNLQKVLSMWPVVEELKPSGTESAFGARKKAVRNAAITMATADATFSHLRRLFRYGFRLSVEQGQLRLRLFFADGKMYRPEGYSRESQELIADLAHLANGSGESLRVGQCRIARAKPVLRALGFPDLDSEDSFALQFAAVGSERWIFIDSRPELFRREIAAALAAKFAESESALNAKIEYRLESDEGPQL